MKRKGLGLNKARKPEMDAGYFYCPYIPLVMHTQGLLTPQQIPQELRNVCTTHTE